MVPPVVNDHPPLTSEESSVANKPNEHNKGGGLPATDGPRPCRPHHPRRLSVPNGSVGSIDTIPPMRYPSSAIAPPLPYLLDLDQYGAAPRPKPGIAQQRVGSATNASICHPRDEVAEAASAAVNPPDQKNPKLTASSKHNGLDVAQPPATSHSHGSREGDKITDIQDPAVRREVHERPRWALHSTLGGEEEGIQRLLQSVPSSFPFPGHQEATNLETLASQLPHPDMRPPHVFRQLQKLSSAFPSSQHSRDSQLVNHGIAGDFVSNPLSSSLSASAPSDLQGDPLLWKLFMSQPSTAAAVAMGNPDAARRIVSPSGVTPPLPARHPHRLRSGPDVPGMDFTVLPHVNDKDTFLDDHRVLQRNEIQARVIGSDTLGTLDLKLLNESRGLPAPQPASPSRLLVVVRRLPDKIVPVLRPRYGLDHTSTVSATPGVTEPPFLSYADDTTAIEGGVGPVEKLDGVLAGSPIKQQFNLTMRQAEAVEWCIERNEFGLDFAQAFPEDMQRVVVADPAITFSQLSKDADVQRSLRRSLRDFLLERNIIPVFLDVYESARSERYSEEVLAPLFHYRTPPVSTGYHNLDWSGYRELNIAFLNAIVEHYKPGDWILVFNYQLMLLPKMLRERPITRDANVGFYLGTVFPSSEMYHILPQREELLRGVLAASFIGFHGFQYKRHFLTACTRVLGVECSGDRIEPDAAVGGGAGARVVTVPRGVNPDPWLEELRKPSTRAKIAELRERLKGRKILLGIDTLDYTKGIPNKILAFNKFLMDHPEWASKVVFFQICVPKGHGGWCQESMSFDETGRSSRAHRREILSTLYQLVGAINANFGNILHQPVHFLLSPLSVENLVCLYGLADIVVITPLRESLSWTAYEFILCQSYTNKGVLILSEFSGSAQSLGAAAICVNPWDADALAVAIHDALVMKEEEKIVRHEYAVDFVLNYDTRSWGRNLLMEFRDAIADIEAERRTIPPPFPILKLIPGAFASATHRILILGLRGTLFPSTYRGVDPHIAGRIRLSRLVDAALHVLSQDPHTHIVIVSSSPATVLTQALGHFPNVTLLAENGHMQRTSLRLKAWRETETPAAGEPAGTAEVSPSALAARRTLSPTSSLSSRTSKDGHEASAVLEPSLSKSSHPSPSHLETVEFEKTTPDIDLSWMDPVEESCRYFEQRTPGSFLYRTVTSIAWNYHGAQREHGTRQARDLLIHLWARPAAVAARTDIVLGPHSVEVRSAATSKAAAVERWLRDVLSACGAKTDVSQCMILCVANFLPCDEDVFTAVTRVLDECSNREVPDKQPLNGPAVLGESQSGQLDTHLSHPSPSEIFAARRHNSGPIVLEEQKTPENATDRRTVLPPTAASSRDLAQPVWMCTVGLKPSRADYFLQDEKEVEQLLTLLASLTVLQPGGIAAQLLVPQSATPDPPDVPTDVSRCDHTSSDPQLHPLPQQKATPTVPLRKTEQPQRLRFTVSSSTPPLLSRDGAAVDGPSTKPDVPHLQRSGHDVAPSSERNGFAAARPPYYHNHGHSHHHHGHSHHGGYFDAGNAIRSKRRPLPSCVDIQTVCSSPDIQRSLVLAAHHYYLPSSTKLSQTHTVGGTATTSYTPSPYRTTTSDHHHHTAGHYRGLNGGRAGLGRSKSFSTNLPPPQHHEQHPLAAGHLPIAQFAQQDSVTDTTQLPLTQNSVSGCFRLTDNRPLRSKSDSIQDEDDDDQSDEGLNTLGSSSLSDVEDEDEEDEEEDDDCCVCTADELTLLKDADACTPELSPSNNYLATANPCRPPLQECL